MFEIRPADIKDLNIITEIYREAVLNGTATYELEPPGVAEMTARFKAITANNYPYFAVTENDVVLGYAYASAFRTRPAYNWLVEDSIYLAPEARGKGMGKALLNALIQRCTELGFRQMVAVIGGASPASIAVHASAGFQHSGKMNATGYKHEAWLDTVFMQLALGPGASSAPDLTAYPAQLHR